MSVERLVVPVTAAAKQLEGQLLEMTGAYADAEAASLTAYMEAAKVRAWDVATRAANNLVFTVGYRQARLPEAIVWARHAEVALLFAGDPLGLGEARRLNNLATVHLAAGAYAESKALFERSRALVEKALGPEHIDVATSLNNLANVLNATGAYPEAKALHERALAIREQALGPEHPDVATSLNNLANVLYATGAYPEVKALYERALAIREQALGPEHPDVAATLSNLAVVHETTGSYEAAKALQERALAIREKVLDPEHPEVAASLSILANIHRATGSYAEAKTLYERARAIREKQGPEHPDLAISLGDLGGLALAQDHPAEAMPLLERAVSIYEAHEGIQELELETRFRLATALVRTGGDLARALAEARKAADGYREAGAGKAKELAEVEAFLAEYGPRAPADGAP